MDLGSKIFELRKKKNLSQEELAERVGVSRQTISKWELNETSPGIEEAKELSKIFNISLDELVGNDVNSILVEKVSNTEKLAGIIINILKAIGIFIICWIVMIVLAIIFFSANRNKGYTLVEETIVCNLHGEEYSYVFNYYDETGIIKEAGGDGYLADVTDIEKYSDAHKALNIIDAYVRNNGGTCERK